MPGLRMAIYDVITVAYVIIALSIFVPWLLLSVAPQDGLAVDVCNDISWFYSHLCNQLPSHSLFLGDIQMPVCARCTSIYLATALGLVCFRLKGLATKEFKINYALVVLLFLPAALDGFTQLFGWRESTNPLRLATGVPYGLGYAYLILWALPLLFVLIELLAAALEGKKTEADALAERAKKMVWPIF